MQVVQPFIFLAITRGFTRHRLSGGAAPGWVLSFVLGLVVGPVQAQTRTDTTQFTLVEEYIRQPNRRLVVRYSLTIGADTLPAPVRAIRQPPKRSIPPRPAWPVEPPQPAPAEGSPPKAHPDFRIFRFGPSHRNYQ